MIKFTSLKIAAFVVYTLIMYSYAYIVGHDNGAYHESQRVIDKELALSSAEFDIETVE